MGTRFHRRTGLIRGLLKNVGAIAVVKVGGAGPQRSFAKSVVVGSRFRQNAFRGVVFDVQAVAVINHV